MHKIIIIISLIVCLSLLTGINTARAQVETQPDFNAPDEASIMNFMKNITPNDSLLSNMVPLDRKHVTNGEIQEFVMLRLSEILNIEAGLVDGLINDRARLPFSGDGFNHFGNFLVTSNLYKSNKDEYKNISTVFLSQPDVVNEGSVDGAYKWLIDVPVLISLYDGNIDTARGNELQRRALLKSMFDNKQKYLFSLQITRIPQTTPSADHIAIDFLEAIEQPL